MRVLIFLFLSGMLISSTPVQGTKSATAFMWFSEVTRNGKRTFFEPLQAATLIANSNEVFEIPTSGPMKLGVRYVMDEDDAGTGLLHSVIFYEWGPGEWRAITSEEHREPANVGSEFDWQVTYRQDENVVFDIRFTCLVKLETQK